MTTLFGTAQLAAGRAAERALDGGIAVPNLYIVSLGRDALDAEFDGDVAGGVEQIRRGVEEGVARVASAHGWRIGGGGTIVVSIAVRRIREACEIEGRHTRQLYRLTVTDSRGTRALPIALPLVTVGRAHEPHPRGFVPVHDDGRHISRDHLRLHWRDGTLTLHLLGRNETTLDGTPLRHDTPVTVKEGDTIRCGGCAFVVDMVEQ